MKIIIYTIIILIFLLGLVLGVVVNDVPSLVLDSKVRLFEPLSFLLTAIIGFSIPFFMKKFIDDNRLIKNVVIDEAKLFLVETSKINEKILYCRVNKSISNGDKNEIKYMFEKCDKRFDSFEKLIKESFGIKKLHTYKDIRPLYFSYWKLASGQEIMSDNFKMITDKFYLDHNNIFSDLETEVKRSIIRTHKF